MKNSPKSQELSEEEEEGDDVVVVVVVRKSESLVHVRSDEELSRNWRSFRAGGASSPLTNALPVNGMLSMTSA